ncbi:MAG: hypothetical protein ABSF52_03870 [Syntrophobacteraceae bacterium]
MLLFHAWLFALVCKLVGSLQPFYRLRCPAAVERFGFRCIEAHRHARVPSVGDGRTVGLFVRTGAFALEVQAEPIVGVVFQLLTVVYGELSQLSALYFSSSRSSMANRLSEFAS